ncbi:transglutaminase domain-containing protein [Hymenobacter taeanensis]|uniref:Transglutaminase domain-containing protein n=1 Tax=Hymenobacter taeanensis TaxID=2735321 RepID=A0A6M6BIX1_9BACT|nr:MULTISPECIES: transglutaminase-like domain-containing protein [Hymenobacter]QJX47949.1 transglutaminase domain-containing protein [Hymenobacter taeanensis]UOQ82602.1 transglutaminase-like domain-containing protein [Hymenobacter sp. 5414T-23]
MDKKFTVLVIGMALGITQAVGQAKGKAIAADPEHITYLTSPDPVAYAFQYSPPSTAYLNRFREMYGLDAVVAQETTDLGRARALSLWVHNRLEHDGHKPFKSTDAFAILHAAMLGHPVQCVEYGLVLTTAFNSLGIPARPLYLKAHNVQTKGSAAGHALTEAWLPDLGKWVMVDSQWDIIPLLSNRPLNALELQQALANDEPTLSALTSTDAKSKPYFRWLKQYLFYFDTVMDNRYGVRSARTGLMLVPVGAHKPVLFQRAEAIHNMRYTHSAATFYSSPSGASWLTEGMAGK